MNKIEYGNIELLEYINKERGAYFGKILLRKTILSIYSNLKFSSISSFNLILFKLAIKSYLIH